MKKRNFLRAVVLMILTLSLMASSIVFVSADGTVADGTVLLNEDMLADRNLSKDFTITNGGSVTYENGALKFVGGGSALNCFDLTGMDLGLTNDIKNFTVMADVVFDTYDVSNLRFAVGTRPRSYSAEGKNQDHYTGMQLTFPSKAYIRFTAVNRPGQTTNSGNVDFKNYSLADAQGNLNVVTYKITFTDNKPSYYFRVNGGEWESIWSATSSAGKAGEDDVLFFSIRNGHTVTVDNLTVYAGTGEAPDASPATVAPWGLGYQLSDVYAGANGNVANIRFIALGTDMDVENVGFKVTANIDGKAWDKNTTTVYSELWGKDAAGVNGAVAKASDYGADFIYGLAITGIPTNTDIEFTVTPYATKDGQVVNGATFRVVVNVPAN